LFVVDCYPADEEFIEAVVALQWGWKHLTQIGTRGRYERRAWENLIKVTRKLPPIREEPE